MRNRATALLAPLFVLGCSQSPAIGPDDAGKLGNLLDASDAAVVDAATDASGPGDPSFQAGTRLKVRYITGSDGSQVALGMFDSQRNDACTFLTATDKETRCLPDAFSLAQLGLVCMDQACTQPVALLPKGCATTPTDVRFQNGATSCGALTYAVATVTGGALSGSTMVWYNGGQVTATTVLNNYVGYDLYATSGIVDPTSFVQGNAVTK